MSYGLGRCDNLRQKVRTQKCPKQYYIGTGLLTSVVGDVVKEMDVMVLSGGGLLRTVVSDAVNCVEVEMVVDVVSIDVSVDKDVDRAGVAEEFCEMAEGEAEEELG